jgi:hypothetical protein
MLSAQSLLFPTGPSLNNPCLKSPLVVPFARYPRRPSNGWKLRLFRSNPNTELTTMAVPANMELDPRGKNMSFLVRVISHPSALLLKVALANFHSLVQFSITIVDMTGQSRRRTACRQDPRELFWWTDNATVPVGNCRSATRRCQHGTMGVPQRSAASASHTRFQASGVISATPFVIPDATAIFFLLT